MCFKPLYYFGLIFVIVAVNYPRSSRAVPIICTSGEVYEIQKMAYLYDQQPEFLITLMYLNKEDYSVQLVKRLAVDLKNSSYDPDYVCVSQYDCRTNVLQFDFCHKIKQSEIFMFNIIEKYANHYTGTHTIAGIKQFMNRSIETENWGQTEKPAARGSAIFDASQFLGLLFLIAIFKVIDAQMAQNE